MSNFTTKQEQDKFLRSSYGRIPTAQIATALNCTEEDVHCRINQLALGVPDELMQSTQQKPKKQPKFIESYADKISVGQLRQAYLIAQWSYSTALRYCKYMEKRAWTERRDAFHITK